MKKTLKTKDFLLKRHVITDVQCPLCGFSMEDVLHVLQDCIHARKAWCSMLPSSNKDEFFSISLESWIMCNLSNTKELLGNVE